MLVIAVCSEESMYLETMDNGNLVVDVHMGEFPARIVVPR